MSRSPARPRIAVVLAAGKGTRMRSDRPKVLHEVAGRPLLDWVLGVARAAGLADLPIRVVVGHGAEAVKAAFAGASDLAWVEQREQRGTGHAVSLALGDLDPETTVVVLSGDVPLARPATLERLLAASASAWGAMAVATMDDPGALGRVVGRDEDGDDGSGGYLARIVEHADASAEERAISLINAGIYALPAGDLARRLAALEPRNAQGELYLTDALSAAARAGERIALVHLADPAEGLGINTRAELAEAHRRLIDRHLAALMEAGVTVLEPSRTVVEPSVRVGPDTVLHPGVSLHGHTQVGTGCVLHQGVWARDTAIADGVTIEPYSVLDRAEVGPAATVGPFARLRPASVLLEGAHVGNFVELKATILGRDSKAGHLTYLGDATVGDRVNVGAGTITCNYDGRRKHRTEIGDGAFIGSDTMLVAPVKVGAEASTGAGSVVTHDVPDGALAVGRARQKTVEGWAKRRERPREP